ncbi:hypothetical protein F444_06110 [Phytophthora nicotianae P1976]|uniref:Uncharacterized protein n=1 Tax=Phytophthora nicotianae P1976 TaxID=1317066 RepID=A0A081AJR7_PHYNI|nr:hypothetical protein F444_06110 [Phytophthora nicotianae P1976]
MKNSSLTTSDLEYTKSVANNCRSWASTMTKHHTQENSLGIPYRKMNQSSSEAWNLSRNRMQASTEDMYRALR